MTCLHKRAQKSLGCELCFHVKLPLPYSAVSAQWQQSGCPLAVIELLRSDLFAVLLHKHPFLAVQRGKWTNPFFKCI